MKCLIVILVCLVVCSAINCVQIASDSAKCECDIDSRVCQCVIYRESNFTKLFSDVVHKTGLYYIKKLIVSSDTYSIVTFDGSENMPKVDEIVLNGSVSIAAFSIRVAQPNALLYHHSVPFTYAPNFIKFITDFYGSIKVLEIENWNMTSNVLQTQGITSDISLEKLAIRKSNITTVVTDFLNDYKHIKSFDLSYNRLTHLQVRLKNSTLEELILSHNLILGLDALSLQLLNNLKVIDLSYNLLVNVFDFIQNIETKSPRLFMLKANHIHCGCLGIDRFQKLLDDKSIWFTEFVCETPQEVNGYDLKNGTKALESFCF